MDDVSAWQNSTVVEGDPVTYVRQPAVGSGRRLFDESVPITRLRLRPQA